MKRIFNYIAVSVMLMTAGCVGNELDNGYHDSGNILTASIRQDETRTSMDEVSEGIYKPVWNSDDCIGVIVNGVEKPVPYTLVEGAGTSVGKFAGEGKGKSYIAYYPYESVTGFDGKSLNVILPAEQEYKEGSFGPGVYPMVAVSSSSDMEFFNICSILKLSLKGKDMVSSIVFMANSEEIKVAGEAFVDINSVSGQTVALSSNASSEVVLLCNDLLLSESDATDFYIVIPAQVYAGGFTIQINGPSGVMFKSTDEDVVMERSQVRAIPEFEYVPMPPAEPSTSLEGKGTEDSPFLISTVSDLLLLQAKCNIGNGTINGVAANTAYYLQTADISLASVCGRGRGSWIPIADYASNEEFEFSGSYDGGGHRITDLYIDNQKDCQGLFGHMVGRLVNLKVSGIVRGKDDVGMLVGTYVNLHRVNFTCIENVEVTGIVEGNINVGGIAGEFSAVGKSVSKVTVTGTRNVAGIAGVLNTEAYECVNEGNVKGDSYVGGISGYHNAGHIYNCVNKGTIDGSFKVGGLAGYTRQSAVVINNLNSGTVTGKNNVGGIAGHCSDVSSRNDMTVVRNNVNLGEVLGKDVSSTGAICGYNTAEVSFNYWFYDPASSKGIEQGVNNDDGTVSSNYALTEQQLKGELSQVAYYVSGKDSYYDLVDALTACAADNTDTSQFDDIMILNGWAYSLGTGYPEITGQEAVRPEGGVGTEPTFEVLADRFEVGPYPSEIEVDVRTNMEYSISSIPDWIKEISVTETSFGYSHVFAISKNTVAASRDGVIVFCNEMQICVPVTVIQEAADPVGDEWKSKDFYHRSLAMRFTADWCVYCPTMATSIEYAKNLMPDKIEAVSLHPSGGLAFSDAYDMMSRFQISGFPSLIVDSRAMVQNYSSSYTSQLIKSVVEETENSYPTSVGIAFKSSLEGNEMTADVNLYIKEAGDYKVTVLLLEDDITGYQSGIGYDYVHNDVVRLALSDMSGESFSVESDGSVWSRRFTGIVPDVCDNSNLRLLVYVEKPFGSQSMAQGVGNIIYGSYGDTYVDNCRSEAVGRQAELQYDDGSIGGLYESSDYSSDGQVVTLQKASSGNGIDIVLMGDAYSDRLIADGTYADIMHTAYEKFFSVEPYRSYRDLFNVYYVNVVSKNEVYGAETALEGYFGDGTYVGGNDQTCFSYALKAISDDRMDEAVIIVMMNSTAYAGTCYMYYGYGGDFGNGTSVSYFPVGTGEEQLEQILHHEAGGHGFAKLADEYAYESMGVVPTEYASQIDAQQDDMGWWKNVDFTNDPSQARWSHFVTDPRYSEDGLGCFEGGLTYWTGVWRPTENSIMRYNTGGFNAPSREAIWYRIHRLAYGDAWTYDYEDFVTYDSVNRTATVRSGHKNYVEMPAVITAPPVVTGKNWRDER